MIIARLAFLLMSISLFSCLALSQLPGPTPTPTPRPGSRAAAVPAVVRDNGSYDRLRAIEAMTDKPRTPSHPMLDAKNGIYRKPSKEEIKVLAVSEQLIAEYASFLQRPNTGIVKLNADSSCVSTTEIVVASEKCAVFKMPGAGAAFSFRTETYRLPRLADIFLYEGLFRADAVLQHVAMANLGDVPIGDVALGNDGLRYLVELRPSADGESYLKYDDDLAKGIQANGFLYRKGHPVQASMTYALRSVAYRGKYIRSVDGISYDELGYDRRRDVIVVFRVVDKDEAGNVTIIWIRLQDTEAPKLKIKE